LVTRTEYEPASAAEAATSEYVEFVAPAITRPFFSHWYVKGPVPAAVTEKLADWPATTLRAAGAEATVAGTFVVTVAVALVAEPAEFVITTS
jgi:hypothetical protein